MGGALTPSGSGPLAPGATRVFTGTFAAPASAAFPAFPGETEGNYVGRLFSTALGYAPHVVATGHAPSCRSSDRRARVDASTSSCPTSWDR